MIVATNGFLWSCTDFLELLLFMVAIVGFLAFIALCDSFLGCRDFSAHLWVDLVFLLALMSETIRALAICSLIFLLDIGFYAYLFIYYVNCDLEPEDFPVSSVMIGIFAFVHLMGALLDYPIYVLGIK